MTLTESPAPESGYRPGRTAEAVMAEYGLTTAVKLSSNEMPDQALPAVAAVLGEAHTRTQLYPDSEASRLRAALAERHRTTPDAVAVGNGSVSLVQALIGALCGPDRPVAFGRPSFEAYGLFARRSGVPEQTAPLRGGGVDLAALGETVTDRTRLVLVCSPNNPTGGTVRRDEFENFLRRVPQALVVLDEAYAEFVTDPEAASGDDLLGRFENLAVLRTFSKAYSLAGLRVGYLVGQPAVARTVRRFAAPFSVNALAQAAAVAALGERETVARRASRVTVERDRVQAALRDAGVDVPGGQGNFLWLPLAEHTMAVSEELERRGVVARPFPPHGLRVTVSTPAHNDFFVDRLTEVLCERPVLFTPADWEPHQDRG